jgi:hypothetical protein
MPICQRRAALSGANLMIFSGQVTRGDLLRRFGAIDESESDSSVNWLIVDNGYADVSDLDFATLLKLKAILAPKMAVMKARRPFDVAIVCQRSFNEPIYLTWQSLVGDDAAYPSNPMLFSDLGAACRRLGYEGPQYAELSDLCADGL